jgi:mRNA interferase YafQ
MPQKDERPLTVRPARGSRFKEKYKTLLRNHPKIAESMRIFNELKRKVPPQKLPHGMREHKLQGRLKGLWECHLDDDVLLIYGYEANIIRLIQICDHDALK